MSYRDKLPDDVQTIGDRFLDAVKLPFNALATGKHEFGSEREFWQQLHEMYENRKRHVRRWPYKAAQRIRELRAQTDLDTRGYLDMWLEEVVLRRARNE